MVGIFDSIPNAVTQIDIGGGGASVLVIAVIIGLTLAYARQKEPNWETVFELGAIFTIMGIIIFGAAGIWNQLPELLGMLSLIGLTMMLLFIYNKMKPKTQ